MPKGKLIRGHDWITTTLLVAAVVAAIPAVAKEAGTFPEFLLFVQRALTPLLFLTGAGVLAFGVFKCGRLKAEGKKCIRGNYPLIIGVVLILLALTVSVTLSALARTFRISYASPVVPKAIEMKSRSDSSVPIIIPSERIPLTDTREFMKRTYDAAIRSRDVQGVVRQTETIVRGHRGRVESVSSNKKYGSVRFAIPADSFEMFKEDVEGLAGSRFIAVDERAQNRLGEKREIESRFLGAKESLNAAEGEKKRAVADLEREVTTYASQVAYAKERLQSVRSMFATATTTEEVAALRASEEMYERELASAQMMRAKVEAYYLEQLELAQGEFSRAEQAVGAVVNQNSAFMDDVETVSGTVTVTWISVLGIVFLYIPLEYWPFVLLGAAALSYVLRRVRLRREG